MQQVSFNAWLSCKPEYAHLAVQWITTRGRLTRDSVERRLPGAGAAFDRYRAEVIAKPPTPPATDDGAVLAFDPSRI